MVKVNRFLQYWRAFLLFKVGTLLTIVLSLFLYPNSAFGYDTGAGLDGVNIDEGKPVHQYITRQAINVLDNANAISEFKKYSQRADSDSIDIAGSVKYSSVNYYLYKPWPILIKADDLISGAAEEDSVKLFVNPYENCDGEALNGFFEHFWDPDVPWAGGFNCGSIGGGYNFGLPDILNGACKEGKDNSYNGLYYYDSAYRLAQYYWDKYITPEKYKSDKRQAYYWLGRIAHLLQDMTVPAHVHNRYHDPVVNGPFLLGDSELFEQYASEVYSNYSGNACAKRYYKYENLINDFQWNTVHDQADPPPLFKLFWYTAQKTQYFATASSNGPQANSNWASGNNWYVLWNKNNDGHTQPVQFTSSLWDNEDLCTGQNVITPAVVEYLGDPNNLYQNGDQSARQNSLDWLANALIPHALKTTAGLYRLFWYTVNPPPQITDISPTEGFPSTIITIKGSNFGSTRGTSYVKFGSQTATTYSLWTDTEIRVTVPTLQPGTYNVTVTTYSDTSNSISFEVRSPTIMVTSPNGSESWTAGTIQKISWTYTGNPGSYVKIELLKGGTVNKTITSYTSKGSNGSGSYNWSISSTQTSGTDYKIKITSTSNSSVTDMSDNNFIIIGTGITVISPNGWETWKVGTTQTIRWTYTGSPGSYVKIELLKSGVLNRTIRSSNSIGSGGSGSYNWAISPSQPAGADYKIRVTSTTNRSYTDTSDNNFTITNDTSPPSIPANLIPTAISSSQIDLTWNASSDDVGVAGYKIYDYYGTYLNSVTTTSTSITGLNSNTYYCFSVLAYDAAGNESGQSSQACVTTQPLVYSISGTVTLSGTALEGVTMTGTGLTPTTTDSNGNYTFPGVQNGSYTITPSKTGYTFTPSNRTVPVNNADVTGQDFVGSIQPQTGVIQLPKTGQTKCYDTAGTEIACTGTGQDGDIQAGVAWPNPRFIDNGDNTVTDNLTGLMWTKDAGTPTVGTCTGGTKSWQEALDYVQCLNTNNYLGHNDWRLPNMNELKSLVNAQELNTATWLNAQGFNNVQSSNYWSSTTLAFDAYYGDGEGVSMYYGYMLSFIKSDNLYVWPVRSSSAGTIQPLKTGQTKCYDSAGNEIACAETGQDGEIQAGVAWPSPRFTDNGDGTVMDNLTGLMWTKDANAPGPTACEPGVYKTWQAALDYIACLNTNSYLGYTDWRLPNLNELESLVNAQEPNKAIWLNTQGFTDVQPYGYWVSTTIAYNTGYAWQINMRSGLVAYDIKSDNLCIWPVRGGLVNTYSISGTVSSCGSPSQGVTVNLSGTANGTTTTDSNGNYSFSGLTNGTYVVTAIGYYSSSSGTIIVNGANVSGVDFDICVCYCEWGWCPPECL